MRGDRSYGFVANRTRRNAVSRTSHNRRTRPVGTALHDGLHDANDGNDGRMGRRCARYSDRDVPDVGHWNDAALPVSPSRDWVSYYRAFTQGSLNGTDSALQELRLAYARGELSQEEFEQRREHLRESK